MKIIDAQHSETPRAIGCRELLEKNYRKIKDFTELKIVAESLGWRDVKEADMQCWYHTGIPPIGEEGEYSIIIAHGRPCTHQVIPDFYVPIQNKDTKQ